MNEEVILEMTIRKRGKDGWKIAIGPSESKKFVEEFDNVMDERGDQLGSFQIVYKVNGGYGKNKEDGRTIVSNYKGQLGAFCHSILDKR